MARSNSNRTTSKFSFLILAIMMALPGVALGAKYFDDTFSATFRSTSTNISTAGALRLSNSDTIGWRNFANGGNLLLSVDSSDRLLFNGVLIGTATAGSFQDSTFSIYDNGDATKKIAFQAAGIGTTQTRTITMPNADVDLGALTNSNIASGAGITYSKLSLTGGIVNADVSGSAAIAYSKLNLGSSIVNSDISAAAGIGVTKLAALTASRPVITDASGFLTTEATLSPIRGGTGLNASASSGLLKFAIGTPTISSGQVVNADVAAAAGIGRTKMEALTANRVVITDASGFDTTEASLAISRGGTGNAGIGTTAGAVVYMDGSKMAATGIGTTGQLLQSNGGAAPTWTTFSASGKAAGEVFMTAATTCPSGSMHADGRSVLRSGGTECGGGSCANLFGAISTTYGTVDGTHFNLPDTRGVFIRGQGSQTISSIGYTGTQGTTQNDAFQGHRHQIRVPATGGGSSFWGFTFWSGNRSTTLSESASVGEDAISGVLLTDGTNGNPRSTSETRPANIVLKYCIVY